MNKEIKKEESTIAKIFRIGGNILTAIFMFLIVSLLIGMFMSNRKK